MYVRALLIAALAACMAPGFTAAQEKRPDWDQKKAAEKVKGLLALEEKGDLPWDKIAWQTDPAKAAAQAQKEGKPIFVFFFLKKDVGPANAPC